MIIHIDSTYRLLRLSFLIVLFSAELIHAQPEITWQNTIGGTGSESFFSIQVTTDGGYILGGRSWSDASPDKSENHLGFGDFWVIKLDANGLIEWENTIGGDQLDGIFSVQQTSEGGYICAGSSETNINGDKTEANVGDRDYWLVKLDSDGLIEWQNTIGGFFDDNLRSVKETMDGGYILGGYSNSIAMGDKSENPIGLDDYWIVKVSDSGLVQWENTIGGSDGESILGESVFQTLDGGYIIGGHSASNISGDKSENSKGGSDCWVVKLDSAGVVQWDKTIGGSGSESMWSMIQSTDGGFVLSASSNSDSSGDKSEDSRGMSDYWVVKLDNAGNVQWDKTIGGSNNDLVYEILETNNGEYLLGGESNSDISGDKSENSKGATDYWIVLIDSLGEINWQKTLGGSDYDFLHDLEQVGNDAFVLLGNSSSDISGDKTENSYSGSSDIWVVGLEEPAPLTIPSINFSGLTEVQVVPNPVKDQFMIVLTGSSRIFGYTLRIVNVLGQIIIELPVNSSQISVTCDEIGGPGLYNIQLIDRLNEPIAHGTLIMH